VRRFTVALLIITFALLATGSATAASSPPRLLRSDVTANFAVRPASMSFGCCGQTFITGPHVSSQAFRAHKWGHIAWNRWRSTGAAGRGLIWFDTCHPDCARGKFQSFPASLQASRVRAGRYTRLVISYPYHGQTAVERLSLKRLSGARTLAYEWF
jgi:hypothetical protein